MNRRENSDLDSNKYSQMDVLGSWRSTKYIIGTNKVHWRMNKLEGEHSKKKGMFAPSQSSSTKYLLKTKGKY